MPTCPRLYRVDQLVSQTVGVADPTALLLENGPGFSVLISHCVDWNPAFRAVELKDAFQLRIEKMGRASIRHYDLVRVSKDPVRDVWEAYSPRRDAVFACPSRDAVFACPSRAPYVLIDLAHDEHERLRVLSGIADTDSIFSYCRDSFGRLPGFYSPAADTLISPADYACEWAQAGDVSKLL